MYRLDSIAVIDCLEGLKQLPDNFIQCCVTSPPYFRLRNYGMEGQYGMEATPEIYIDNLVKVFAEVKRVLKPDGILWLNLGDSYWGSGKAGNNPDYQSRHIEFGKPSKAPSRFGKPTTGKHAYLKPKDLIGIPWKVAFALQQHGWWLRQEIIWHKANCMPESVEDRCTRCHEHIFMLAKSASYFYNNDSIKTEALASSMERMRYGRKKKHKYCEGTPGYKPQTLHRQLAKKQEGHGSRHAGFNERYKNNPVSKANRRSVWKFSTKGLKEKHFAVFPKEIPEICIKASTKEGDIVLDPFSGAGTTALAAALLDRHYIGFELNPEYVAIARKRLRKHLGVFYKE